MNVDINNFDITNSNGQCILIPKVDLDLLTENICTAILQDKKQVIIKHLFGDTYLSENGRMVGIPIRYIIYVRKANKEEIDLFKKVNPIEKRWEDFPSDISGWYISSGSKIYSENSLVNEEHNKNVWPSKELAEAALALSQLYQRWHEVTKPSTSEIHYRIAVLSNRIGSIYLSCNRRGFHFNSKTEAERFIKDHKSLLEKAKILL